MRILNSTRVTIIILIPVILLAFHLLVRSKTAAQSVSFTFTAAGDYASHTIRTTAVLNGINPSVSGADFNLALGDLSYGSKTPESAWCDYVKSKVGDTFPFELIPGNHEASASAGNFIDNFEQCLPHRLGPITGRYSREYFYDHPMVNPMARFINISPHLTFPDEGTYTYVNGNSHYTWVANAIDTARAAGIQWIIVTMHENCISMGRKSCTIGESLFNLLVDKKVDLILQGHDHNYQRSKQLALGPSCSGIVRNSYNANCVSDDGSDDNYIKGAGTVLNIVGTGGISNYDINTADSETPYFAKWNGVNSDPTVGFLKATVSSTQMSLSFNPMYGPAFSDSFTIVDPSFPTVTLAPPTETPIPSPTPTIDPFAPTPTVTPIPSPTPLILTLNPIADTTVKSNSPSKNYGTITTLQIDGTPVKISYLKFDLSALAQKSVLSAILRLHITNGTKSTQVVKEVSDTSWQETLVSYDLRPALGDVVTSFPGGTIGTWREIPVTSAVTANAGQFLSLGIDSAGADGLDAYSRENATNKPELVITYQ